MAKNSLPNARKAKQEEDLSGQLNTEIVKVTKNCQGRNVKCMFLRST